MNKQNTHSKNILAKLMSIENISIEHRKVDTAYFDIKNRILILPQWVNISEDLYTLLISHEVSHALYTAKDDFLNEVVNYSDQRLKIVFNIVEDARIEKLIKRKFPGIIPSFIKGYSELYSDDFFQLKDKNIDECKFLDKINLHFKLKINEIIDLNYSEKLSEYISKIENCETLYESIAISKELLNYVDEIKEENSNDTITNLEQCENSLNDSEDNSVKVKKVFVNEELSDTSKALEDGLKSIIDNNSDEVVYSTIPKYSLKEIVTPYKKVFFELKSYYYQYPNQIKKAKDSLDKFKQKNNPIISHMSKLFEMRKKASEFKKIKISKTGILNLDKLHTFKYSEDIFKRNVQLFNDKNHGVVIFLDMSGSMTSYMKQTIEQLLCLVIFCRKVKIPFEVYGFKDNRKISLSAEFYNSLSFKDYYISPTFELRQYFSSEMNNFEFNYALIYLMALYNTYSITTFSDNYYSKPPEECLGGTPLNQALAVSITVIENFKKKYNNEKVNLILLTDGEATDSPSYFNDDGHSKYMEKNSFIKYQKSKNHELEFVSSTYTTYSLLHMIKEITNIQILGFYILSNSGLNKSTFNHITKTNFNDSIDENKNSLYYEKLQNDGYVIIENKPYDHFYLLIGDDNFSSFDDTNIFQIDNYKKQFSKKILINKFIDAIS